jgi:hypothetical protein
MSAAKPAPMVTVSLRTVLDHLAARIAGDNSGTELDEILLDNMPAMLGADFADESMRAENDAVVRRWMQYQQDMPCVSPTRPAP